MRRLRILYLSCEDPYNKRSWSGAHYNMITQLNKFFDITAAGPLHTSKKISRFFRWFNVFLKHIFRKKYNTMHARMIGRDHQQQLREKLKGEYDLIFSTASSRELSELNTNLPIVHFSDATFDLIHNYYPGFSNLISYSVHESRKVEKHAIQKASILLYTSSWAAGSAIKDYHAPSDRVHVTPFGANIEEVPAFRLDDRLASDSFHLLFLGVSWIRKGGDIVYATFLELKKKGLKCKLTICGCTPPVEMNDPEITIIPFLDKNKEDDRNRFRNMMEEAHVLFLPTRADCTPIVFSEAAAYGLPVISTDTGGVSSIIRNDINGYCLPYNASAADYARVIESIALDKNKYASLAQKSRDLFFSEYNWDTWGRTVCQIIENNIVKKIEPPAYSIARSK